MGWISGHKPNRLIDETSPYLLQHAYNPVEWFPWGEEALATARRHDRPILLSVGYAACHWCHVMERESFENEQTAALMNEHFVCIKVDREERPDLDAIYMDAVQAMTGQGGWPMTMFLTPDGEPFFGGTYFPPEPRHGLPAFEQVLRTVAEAWQTRREEIVSQGKKLKEHIESQTRPRPSSDPLSSGLIGGAATLIGRSFDEAHGGFGGPPKFPQAPVLESMIRAAAAGASGAQRMVETTLNAMARGGIYDQLGGGFHRYSVDEEWLVPHFEKMLYDQAQLIRVYTHAWQAWGDDLYRRIAIETAEYLLRDMRADGSGFYSSEDADSEGVEGKFYVWDYEEFRSIAPEGIDYYGVRPEGNFEGANILTASSADPPDRARRALFEGRSTRPRPGRDEKVLTSWNGLAIAALGEAGAVFERRDFLVAAEEAASFLLEQSRDGSGRLFHSVKDGRAKVPGLLEDYAYLTDALFTLWEATFEVRWAREAQWLCRAMLELFHDPSEGGFFTTGRDHEQLIVRPKEIVESATPSPNAVASLLLQKMGVLLGDQDFARAGAEVLRLAHPYMERAPQAVGTHLCALDFYTSTAKEIAIVGDRKDDRTMALLREIWRRFIPNKVMAGSPPGIDSPILEGKETKDGPLVFVCENYLCKAPASEPKDLARQLE